MHADGDLLATISATYAIIALTWVSVFAGAIVSGLTGFAFSAISGSLVLHWLSPTQAVPLLVACSITTQAISIARLWRSIEWGKCLPFLLGGIVGIPLGAMILQGLNPRVFSATFGMFLVAYSGYLLLRPAVTIAVKGRLSDIAAGFAGGITGGAIAFPGAVPTLWCSLRGLPKHAQRGIIQPFILLMQLGTLGYFSKLGILASATMSVFLWCIPAVLCGTWLGLHVFHQVDETTFRRLVLIFLLISGATLIV